MAADFLVSPARNKDKPTHGWVELQSAPVFGLGSIFIWFEWPDQPSGTSCASRSKTGSSPGGILKSCSSLGQTHR
ncbi:MAG TPA: hypothetical protein DEQ73_02300, partial [Phycisphaerales bacterium]|nr:hypothetical protein [Phycisphaerales bacterium]